MSLDRFKAAQADSYDAAFNEIKNGRKRSHWMWYIFPQIAGLGMTETSRYYAIKDLNEAKAYLQDKELSGRLISITQALLDLNINDPHLIFGSPDDMKLCSSMTLFEAASQSPSIYSQVLDKFFNSKRDKRTLQLLGIY